MPTDSLMFYELPLHGAFIIFRICCKFPVEMVARTHSHNIIISTFQRAPRRWRTQFIFSKLHLLAAFPPRTAQNPTRGLQKGSFFCQMIDSNATCILHFSNNTKSRPSDFVQIPAFRRPLITSTLDSRVHSHFYSHIFLWCFRISKSRFG